MKKYFPFPADDGKQNVLLECLTLQFIKIKQESKDIQIRKTKVGMTNIQKRLGPDGCFRINRYK
jgi:hypothetical protein